MSAISQALVQVPLCPGKLRRLGVRQHGWRPTPPLRQPYGRVHAVAAPDSNGASFSPIIGSQQQQHVIKMVNLVSAYFNTLLTKGDLSVLEQILDASISHKDMVRNVGRVGWEEYARYLTELHRQYPDYYVKPTQFGFVDNRSLFVAFEGQVSAQSNKFYGVDLFLFNADSSKIQEVQVYRSNWLGAQGHEERKRLAEAAAQAQQEP